MQEDDETTAHQLFCLLIDRGYNLSLQTILRCQSSLGWTFRGSAYCQLIRNANKSKRLEFVEAYSTPQIKLYVAFMGTIVLQIEINCQTIVLHVIVARPLHDRFTLTQRLRNGLNTVYTIIAQKNCHRRLRE